MRSDLRLVRNNRESDSLMQFESRLSGWEVFPVIDSHDALKQKPDFEAERAASIIQGRLAACKKAANILCRARDLDRVHRRRAL